VSWSPSAPSVQRGVDAVCVALIVYRNATEPLFWTVIVRAIESPGTRWVRSKTAVAPRSMLIASAGTAVGDGLGVGVGAAVGIAVGGVVGGVVGGALGAGDAIGVGDAVAMGVRVALGTLPGADGLGGAADGRVGWVEGLALAGTGEFAG
jgi:hypothetical protein